MSDKRIAFTTCLALLFALCIALPTTSIAGIVGSKHDLSVTNFYGNYNGAATEICVFCHTPPRF